MSPIRKICTFIVVAQLLLSNPLWAAAKQPDVRILVDVSGSMKRNDPKNLRIPAVRLVTGLLPKNAKAGLWLFAENVENIAPVAKITSSTKKRLNKLASRIHNRGLFTNIGAALEAATEDWNAADDSTQRIIILLTDGVVDISKDPTKNAQERERIKQQLFPKLKNHNARIYTIALSDEADGELLAQLSNTTDAWFEAVKTAEQLEKVFLKIFEQSVSVPTLPIENNKFKVDQSVDEFTALVFRNSMDPISLVSPSGQVYEADTISARLSWFEEKKFDLVTLRKPEAGVWQITGPVDPSNRVMVVSDLSMDVNNDELPTSLYSGDSIDFKVSLQEKGQVISRPLFLKLIHFSGLIDTSSTAIDTEIIPEDDGENGDKKKADGIFGYHFTAPKIDENVTFELQVSSPTFGRVYRRSVKIFSSYVKYKTTVAKSLQDFHSIEIKPLTTIVDGDSLKVSGVLKLPDGSEIQLEFKKNKSSNWQAEIAADSLGGIYTANLAIELDTLSGKNIKLQNEVISFEAKPFETEQAQTLPEIEPETDSAAEVTETAPIEAAADKKPAEDTKTEIDPSQQAPKAEIKPGLSTFWWIVIGLVFNIIMFGGGFLLWKRWKKKQAAEGDDLANALDEEVLISKPDGQDS